MKAKLYVYLLLTAVISVFTISGCDKAFEAEPAATIDETVITSTATIITTAITTSAPPETTVGETTSAPKATTAAEEVTEAIEVNQNSENTQKPDNTSDNANSNATSNTTTNKPDNNLNGAVVYFDKNYLTVTVLETEYLKVNSVSGCSVEADNNNVKLSLTDDYIIVEGRHSGNSVITATASTGETVTCNVTVLKRDTSSFTDDTPLTFEEMNTEEMMQRMVDDCIEYFTSLGMTYNNELDPSWSGWFYGWQGGLSYTDVRSYNETSERNIIGIQEQVDAILIEYYGSEYTDITFKPCYELTDRGTYSIIFA